MVVASRENVMPLCVFGLSIFYQADLADLSRQKKWEITFIGGSISPGGGGKYAPGKLGASYPAGEEKEPNSRIR